MQRLRDATAPVGSPEAELAEAVAAMPPVVATPARQQRVLAAVTARRRWRRWGAAAWLRPTLAGALLLVAGAAGAAATVGQGWVARTWQKLTDRHPAPTLANAPAPSAPARPARNPVARVAEPAPPIEVAPSIRPVPVRTATHARLARGEDPTALVAAVRALRGDHDPARAGRLLDAYLRSYPRGALAEEALALEIEAAATLKSPRAADFARQYLRLYPKGRFQPVARQALDAGF